MLTIAFCLYRNWGFQIYREIKKYEKIRGDFKIIPLIASKEYQFNIPKNSIVVDPNNTQEVYKILKKRNVDIAFFYSWNYFVREPIISEFICMCLHPSLVPKNRGGTPIQNQIIKGVENSGVSLFRMDDGMDTGEIYKQASMSLIGDINDVFKRMVDLGTIMTKNLISDYINNDFKLTKQKNPKKHPPLKRRTPEMSEIKDIEKWEFKDLEKFVNCLLPPYPNAFIVKGDKKILIQKVLRCPQKPKGLSFKVKNGWVKVVNYKKLSLI